MAGREGPYRRDYNSTSYVHPKDENLNNLHKAMEYNDMGEPRIRVTAEGLTLVGNVNLGGPVEIQNDEGNPIPISANLAVNAANNPIYVAANVTGGNINANVSGTITSITNTVNVNILNSPSVTVSSGNINANVSGTITSITNTVNVNILSIPEVEIKNDLNNPIPISRTTAVNSSTNPIYVSGSGGSMGSFPDSATTAFDEPFAVTITPVLQGDVIYGQDPDFWNTTELNNGNVTITGNNTWEVHSGTTAGGYARLATSRYMTYQPGQGSMFRWTAAFTTSTPLVTDQNALGITNIVQNTGPIDREDGYSVGFSGSSDTSNSNKAQKIGFLHRRNGKAEVRTLTLTTAPTGAQTATITLNGVAYTAAITAGTTAYCCAQIAAHLKTLTAGQLWDIDACGNTMTFSYYSPGSQNGTYSFSSSGTGTLAAGTFARTVTGASPVDTWTYVSDWNGTVPTFDPTKLNVFGVDFRWLGAGIVRLFMEDPSTGKMVLVHTQRWASTSTIPHIQKPSQRIVYRSGTTNPAITPSQDVVVTGASVMAAVQGVIQQTSSSQSFYNLDGSTRAKDTVWHLLSIQNPYVRNGVVNKSSIVVQDLSVSLKSTDPAVIYLVKNAVGTSDFLVFGPLPNASAFNFVQYSTSAVTETLANDTLALVQTVSINGSAQFNLLDYNLYLSPGDTMSAFISSTSSFNSSSIGMTWKVD